MTFLNIMVLLGIGGLMLLVGAVAKRKWLMLLSILPLAVSLYHLVKLLLLGMS